METKQMYVADLNIVFGKKEEPLIEHIDDIVLPALQDGLYIEASERIGYVFENVKLNEIESNEYVIQGILIKDTILDVMSEYSRENGLEKTDKHFKSSPYSVFIVYLKNHRMVLVKNQSGSPDIRSFGSALKEAMKRYVVGQNQERKLNAVELLPMPKANIAGIKTVQSVKEALKDVEKISQLVFKFYPLNEEWDYGSVFGEIDKKIRKEIESKKGKMVFPSPKSKDGVAEIIKATEGLVQSEMKVIYKSDLSVSGTKKKGVIRDSEISEVMNVDLINELDEAYLEIHESGKGIKALEIQTQNNLLSYQRFLSKKKK